MTTLTNTLVNTGLLALIGLGAWLGAPHATAEEARSTVIGDLQWALNTNGRDITWPDAEAYCADLELDDHDDWRLPTMPELESLRDPEAPTGIRAPIDLDTCCLWSSTTLEQRESEDSHEIGGTIEMYRWGYMFDADVPYYAVHVFDDGRALCVRAPEAG